MQKCKFDFVSYLFLIFRFTVLSLPLFFLGGAVMAENYIIPSSEKAWGDYSFRRIGQTIYSELSSDDTCSRLEDCDNIWPNENEKQMKFVAFLDDLSMTHILFHAPPLEQRNIPEKNGYRKISPDKDIRMPLIVIHGWRADDDLNPSDTDSVEKHYERLVGHDGYFENFRRFAEETEISNKFRLYYYSYPSYKHVTYNARQLAELIKENQYIKNWIKNSNGKIAILAHSMGGLVARSLLEEHGNITVDGQQIDLADKLIRLITLGTPHRGSPASIENWFPHEWIIDIVTNRSTPGSQDLYWDNSDGIFSDVEQRQKIFFPLPPLSALGTEIPPQRIEVNCEKFTEGNEFFNTIPVTYHPNMWYRDDLRNPQFRQFDQYFLDKLEQFFGEDFQSYKELCFWSVEDLYIQQYPIYPNPWLTHLNEKLRRNRSGLKAKYYFYAGIHRWKNDDSRNIINDEDWAGTHLAGKYAAGQKGVLSTLDMLSDGVVPLSSAMNGNYLDLINHDRFLTVINSYSPKLRFLQDYHHARIVEGAYNNTSQDILNPDKPSGILGVERNHNPLARLYYMTNAFNNNRINGVHLKWKQDGNPKLLFDPLFIRVLLDLDDAYCLAQDAICNPQFFDLHPNQQGWFFKHVQMLARWRAISITFPKFQPSQKITRSDFIAWALVGFGLAKREEPMPETAPFDDVPRDNLNAPYISIAKSYSIVEGFEEGTAKVFKPDQSITRAEAAKILLVLLGITDPSSDTELMKKRLSKDSEYMALYQDYNQEHWFIAENWLVASDERRILQGKTPLNLDKKVLALDEHVARSGAAKMIGNAVCQSAYSDDKQYRQGPTIVQYCKEVR